MMNKKLIWIFNSVLIIVFAVIMVDFFGILGSRKTVEISINEGDGLAVVSERLKENNIVLSKNLFRIFCKIGNSDIVVKPGTIKVYSKMSYRTIMDELEKADIPSITVTIPEGFETREIADRLLMNDVIKNEEEFYNALNEYSFTLEDGTEILGSETGLNGFLYPDTYNFYENTSAVDVIKTMTDNFKRYWKSEYTKELEKRNMSVSDAVILASIIEREGNNPEDFKLVSSVFHNRIEQNMKLESCATVQYILSERKPVLSLADTKIKSPYNTYLNTGLPPTAIASAGLDAIKAAVYPEESEYLFFFTDKNGVTHFSKTLDEHNSLISKFGL